MNTGLSISLAHNKNVKNFNCKKEENNNIKINNILINRANRKEIKIEKVERVIKINKNQGNISTGTNANNNNNIIITDDKSEIIITLQEKKKEILLVKKSDKFIEISKKQPRKIEIIPQKMLICQEQEPIISKIVQEGTKEIKRIGNNFIRIPQEEAKRSCDYFCDYLHLNDPKYLTDINKEIYEDLIKNQVKKIYFIFLMIEIKLKIFIFHSNKKIKI